jgi:hypothetical protein
MGHFIFWSKLMIIYWAKTLNFLLRRVTLHLSNIQLQNGHHECMWSTCVTFRNIVRNVIHKVLRDLVSELTM